MDNSELEKLQKDAALLAKRAAVYSVSVIPNDDVTDTHDSEVEREIKAECEMLAQEILNVHSRLESRLETEQPKGTKDTKEVLQTVYKAKERRLRGEIEALESMDIEVVSTHPDFVDVIIKKQMSDTITQLEETLSKIRTERKQVAELLERERSCLDQQREVQQSLMAEIQRLNEKRDNPADESDIEELEEKKQTAITMHRKLMLSFASFVNEHYKPQNKKSEPPERRSKMKLDGRQKPHYESLLQFIEVLMNRLFEAPHDPYIQLTERHWPPYVELLLRCGIGQRHPDDHHRFRLTPYHL